MASMTFYCCGLNQRKETKRIVRKEKLIKLGKKGDQKEQCRKLMRQKSIENTGETETATGGYKEETGIKKPMERFEVKI